MGQPVILVTGASGFLGSAVCVELAADHRVVGLDRRPPGAALRQAAPGAEWLAADITDGAAVERAVARIAARLGPPAVVVHLAAYYHFGRRWRPEYQDTNIEGTRHLLEAAAAVGVQRFIFASSIAALEPPPPGAALTESASRTAPVAYARSKALGERLLAAYAGHVPAVSLRIGGVFGDWCELPPLYSLIKLWSLPPPLGRVVPGRGGAGFPYIHRRDFTAAVRRIIARRNGLPAHETLFAAPDGATCQRDLYPVVRAALGRAPAPPLFLAPVLIRPLLFLVNRVKGLAGLPRYERRWMLDYVDRPLAVDTAYTRRRLAWTPRPELTVVRRLPRLVARFRQDRRRWERRNHRRNAGCYDFQPD